MIRDQVLYQSGGYDVRSCGGLFKVFRCGRFVFSTLDAEKARRWIRTRRTLEIRGASC